MRRESESIVGFGFGDVVCFVLIFVFVCHTWIKQRKEEQRRKVRTQRWGGYHEHVPGNGHAPVC